MSHTTPDATLFIAPGCPHCPVVLQGLSELVKLGEIGRLEVVNVAVHPAQAADAGVRTVPYTRIGAFEFDGAQTIQELRHWTKLAASADGITSYLEELLRNGNLTKAELAVTHHPDWLQHLLPLLPRSDLQIQVRIGIGALFEFAAGTPALKALVQPLGQLSRAPGHNLRADACHYLALSGSKEAVPYLQACLNDDNAEVREIAAEGLEELQ